MTKGGYSSHEEESIMDKIIEVLNKKGNGQLEAIYGKLTNTPVLTRVKKYLAGEYDIRFNLINNDFEYRLKGEDSYEELNENDLYIELQEDRINCSIDNLRTLLKSKYIKNYNPIKTYFDSLPKWEVGDQDYISELAGYIQTTDQKRWLYHFKKYIVRVVACATIDGAFNKQCLTLRSGQNDGKSTFCRFLCPPTLSKYFIENVQADKDGRIALGENLIINMDELASMSRQEINDFKAMLSKPCEKVRRPYDRKAKMAQRIASFVASTNDAEFLTDTTGSVRWLVFDVLSIDFAYSREIDIDLVYAQALALLKSGFEYQLDKSDVSENEQVNRKYQVKTPEMEIVAEAISPVKKSDYEKDKANQDYALKTATQLIELFGERAGSIRLNAGRMGRALRYFGFEQTQARVGDNGLSIRVWIVKLNNRTGYENIAINEGKPGIKEEDELGYPKSWDKK
ncbi:hypothetical protein BKI52_32835 [marine bacterium AO1-C]|nr:hypothetical protein BKI52_32835 [marine bacterium AO1-C]